MSVNTAQATRTMATATSLQTRLVQDRLDMTPGEHLTRAAQLLVSPPARPELDGGNQELFLEVAVELLFCLAKK